MKFVLYTLTFFALVGHTQTSFSQCPIPNKDFTGYWIVGTLTTFVDIFDPEDWQSTVPTVLNAVNYGKSGLYPTEGSNSPYDAVLFDLSGSVNEAGISLLNSILCSNYPTSVHGKFKHLGPESDTLFFSLYFSDIDVWGDTTRETMTAQLVCNTLVSSEFQSFQIPIPQPHLNIYTQIDKLEIVYKSVSDTPGSFVLDEVDFGYTSSIHEGRQKTSDIQVLPSITPQFAQIVLPTSSSDWQINIVNTTGATVRSLHSEVSEAVGLDLTDLTNGIYYVICKPASGETVYVGKVVKI